MMAGVIIVGMVVLLVLVSLNDGVDKPLKSKAGAVGAGSCGWLGASMTSMSNHAKQSLNWVSGSWSYLATQQAQDVTLGLENELVNLRESTAKMTVARSSSLIEYAQAFIAGQAAK